MLTASGQQADSIKFSPSETKNLIEAWENYPKLKRYADSTDQQLLIIRDQKSNDSILLHAAKEVIKSKDQVITANQNLVSSDKSELKHERTWRKVWKSISGGFGLVAAVEAGYIYLLGQH